MQKGFALVLPVFSSLTHCTWLCDESVNTGSCDVNAVVIVSILQWGFP